MTIKSINIWIAISSSFHAEHLPASCWVVWARLKSSSFCCAWTNQLLEQLEQGSASLVGEAIVLKPDLESGISGVLNCFPGVLITGSLCLLDSGLVDPRDDACKFNSSRGCQDNRVRAYPSWRLGSFPIFRPCLISWLIGMNSIAQGIGVLSKVSWAIS